MRKMRADEEAHIKTIGESVFMNALAKTSLCVRSDRRLVGIDKIRDPLAFQAALEATGFERKPFTLGKKEIPADTLEICEELLAQARESAAHR